MVRIIEIFLGLFFPVTILAFVPNVHTEILHLAHKHPSLKQPVSVAWRPNAKVRSITSINVSGQKVLRKVDSSLLDRIIRIANHVPALVTIYYFGLIAGSMSGMQAASEVGPATLRAVLTKRVGPTTQAAFSKLFPTLVTPASFVFLIWPFISFAQLLTLAISALSPKDPLLSQDELTSLSLANLAATSWLLISSQAVAGSSPLASCLVLPFVALFSGYPLRKKKPTEEITLQSFVFQVFSSFTALASLVAFAVELQHGGRIPFTKGRAEVTAILFLLGFVDVAYAPNNGIVKRAISLFAIGGILWKRVVDALVLGSAVAVLKKLGMSLSFWGTVFVTLLCFANLEGENSDG